MVDTDIDLKFELFGNELDCRPAKVWMDGPNWHVLDTNSDSLACKFCGKELGDWNIFERCPKR